MKRWLRWLPAILHASLLFALSSLPELRIATEPVVDTVLRKLGHLGAYALLAIFVAYALGNDHRDRRTMLTLGIIVAYAVSDEVHQAFVPGRVPAMLDVAIDAVGGVLGLIAVRFVGDRLARGKGHVAVVRRSTDWR